MPQRRRLARPDNITINREAPATLERRRISSYQARIERTLTDIYMEVSPDELMTDGPHMGRNHWRLEAVGHINAYAQCELCGHYPIRRLYWIRNTTNDRELMVGSECARNYADVDLLEAYERRLRREQGRLRRVREREERIQRLREEHEGRSRGLSPERIAITDTRDATRREWWQNYENREAIQTFLADFRGDHDFLVSVREFLANRGYLTRPQADAVMRWVRAAPIVNEGDEPPSTTPVDTSDINMWNHAMLRELPRLPSIPNGTYSVTYQGERREFRVKTITYSARTPALVGRRVIEYFSPQDGRWEAFGFVDVAGDEPYVRWSRYRDLDREWLRLGEWMARQLHTTYGRDAGVSDPEDRPWMVININGIPNVEEPDARGVIDSRMLGCTRCNEAIRDTNFTSRRTGLCSGCDTTQHEQREPSRRPTIRRSPRTPRRRAQSVAPGTQLMSEINDKWLR